MTTPVHTLYRFFDADDTLLYVGRTVNARGRWRDHERSKDWFDSVTRVTREVHPDAETLAAAELAAIQSEHPVHNVAHNKAKAAPKPKPKRPTWQEADDHFITRQVSLQVDRPVLPKACDDPDVESHCECLRCHNLRWAYLSRIEWDYEDDPTMLGRIAKMREEYSDGCLMGYWLDELFDLRMFRTFDLVNYSTTDPAPCFAFVIDLGVQIACPFCHGLHEHFLRSGANISAPMDSGCGWGRYTAMRDLDAFMNSWFAWLDRNEREAVA